MKDCKNLAEEVKIGLFDQRQQTLLHKVHKLARKPIPNFSDWVSLAQVLKARFEGNGEFLRALRETWTAPSGGISPQDTATVLDLHRRIWDSLGKDRQTMALDPGVAVQNLAQVVSDSLANSACESKGADYLEGLKSSADQANRLLSQEKSILNLQGRVRDLRSENNKLKIDLKTDRDWLASTRARVTEQDEQIEALQGTLRSLEIDKSRLDSRIEGQRKALESLRDRAQEDGAKIDSVYRERNLLAIALARLTLRSGRSAGWGLDGKTQRAVVYVQLPGGQQVSWHMDDALSCALTGGYKEGGTFGKDLLPKFEGEWDGTFKAREADWPTLIRPLGSMWSAAMKIDSKGHYVCAGLGVGLGVGDATLPFVVQGSQIFINGAEVFPGATIKPAVVGSKPGTSVNRRREVSALRNCLVEAISRLGADAPLGNANDWYCVADQMHELGVRAEEE